MFAWLMERMDAQEEILREIKFDVIKLSYKVDQYSSTIHQRNGKFDLVSTQLEHIQNDRRINLIIIDKG